jgi:hypothetical protein
MTPQEKKEIREKWKKQYPDCTTGEGRCIDCFDKDDIENFWLAVLDTKLKQQLEEIESEIEGEKPKRDYDGNNLESACDKYHIAADSWTEIIRFEDGMNHALDSAKAIISKYKEI